MTSIDDLYIVNYCHPNCTPLMNLMRLDQEAAFVLANELAAKNAETTAFYRFADFQNYYPLRLEADHMLHKSFIALGGKPQTKHPLFFVLQGSAYLDSWFDHGTKTTLLLKNIPSEYVSFTYGDSCALFRKSSQLSLITKENLLGSISNFEGTLDVYMKDIAIKCHYIEAQLWCDDFALNDI